MVLVVLRSELLFGTNKKMVPVVPLVDWRLLPHGSHHSTLVLYSFVRTLMQMHRYSSLPYKCCLVFHSSSILALY